MMFDACHCADVDAAASSKNVDFQRKSRKIVGNPIFVVSCDMLGSREEKSKEKGDNAK